MYIVVMKMPNTSVSILCLLVLLFSQVSSSFAVPMTFSSLSDTPCKMTMEHHDVSHNSTATMAMSHNNLKADCCDTHDMSKCAEGQCDCIVLSFVAAFNVYHVPEQLGVNATKASSDSPSFVLSAYSAPLIRPPIKLAQ